MNNDNTSAPLSAEIDAEIDRLRTEVSDEQARVRDLENQLDGVGVLCRHYQGRMMELCIEIERLREELAEIRGKRDELVEQYDGLKIAYDVAQEIIAAAGYGNGGQSEQVAILDARNGD